MTDEYIPTLSHATERDIDLLLVEELFASSNFVSWMLGRAKLPSQVCSWKVLHSKRRTRSRREIDIYLEADTSEGERVALLVENKLDATEQPDQAESYREELDAIADHFLHRAVVIVCPQAYAEQHRNFISKFDACVSYEALTKFFGDRAGMEEPEGARMRFRADIIEQAITKGRRGYIPVPNPVIGTFNESYVRLLDELAPEIAPGPSMLKPANPDESVSMIYDANRSLEFLPADIRPSRFAHELGKGTDTRANYVAVVFPGWGQALPGLREEFERDTAAVGATFSAKAPTKVRPRPGLVMSWQTEPVNNQASFDEQRDVIARGIETARALRSWLKENEPTLLRWKRLVEMDARA